MIKRTGAILFRLIGLLFLIDLLSFNEVLVK